VDPLTLKLNVVIDSVREGDAESILYNGDLRHFFETLILGAPLPLELILRSVQGPNEVMAATLFLCRDLLLVQETAGLVYQVDLVLRHGDAMLAHSDPMLSQFLRGLRDYFHPYLSQREAGERLLSAVQWVREYVVERRLPSLGPVPPAIRVLDVGTGGFVLASAMKVSEEAWEALFRQGHLRGMLVGDVGGHLVKMVLARKSSLVGFDLGRLRRILDDLEVLSGNYGRWGHEGDYLWSPPDGSMILVGNVLEAALRV
jgi:hypothetical protein